MTDLPDPRHCKCGHRYGWFEVEENPDTTSFSYKMRERRGMPHIRLRKSVVERPCPHRNGTVIQYCPECGRNLGMWGCGLAGGMECSCWGYLSGAELKWKWRQLLWTYDNWDGVYAMFGGDEYYRRTLLVRIPFTTRAVVVVISRPGVLYDADDYPDPIFERWLRVKAA